MTYWGKSARLAGTERTVVVSGRLPEGNSLEFIPSELLSEVIELELERDMVSQIMAEPKPFDSIMPCGS